MCENVDQLNSSTSTEIPCLIAPTGSESDTWKEEKSIFATDLLEKYKANHPEDVPVARKKKRGRPKKSKEVPPKKIRIKINQMPGYDAEANDDSANWGVEVKFTCKRNLQLRAQPLVHVELFSALSTKDPVYREEEESFLSWGSKTPLGRRKQRGLEMKAEVKLEKETGGDKKGKKKK